MDYNIHKMCRICLEEGPSLTHIFNTEFSLMPAEMIMMCAKVKVSKMDSMPAVICNNCIYRLGVAYHFKQQCENSDIRLRQYLGILDKDFFSRDAETMTDDWILVKVKKEEMEDKKQPKKSKLKSSRYKRKAPEEKKKRGPKPIIPKIPQTCFHCNKTFKCSAQLQMHIRIHTGERPFSCSFCHRRFAQKHNLAIHSRTHTGEKPFQCEICSKQFSAMGNFQAHKKIHSNIRDQICHVCNKGFISSSDLARHMITHTGIKNFHCDCGKSFSRNRDMIAHKKKIHLNERSNDNFKCPECHKLFLTSSSLSIHFKTHSIEHTIVQPSVQTLVPSSSISLLSGPVLGGSLGPASSLGVGIGLHPGFSQGTLSMMHTQRLHPY